MSNIANNLQNILSELNSDVTLVAVSKTKPNADIQEAYDAGQRHFGENKVQEMVDKWESLPKDIHWHMIGHVQTNKIKYMAPFVHLIHGCDREKVLKMVNKEAAKNDRTIDVLLQVHIAEESSKFGFDEAELLELIESGRWSEYENVRIRGLMGMATFTDDQDQIKREFATLKTLFDKISKSFGDAFDTLSMGMSGDYPIALEAGSNMVRVGSAIFGARNYDA
ncbi:MAG: YggS family pyridoxal phosphate-dependent enzyme [Flavobacteriia bacterium]|nr:YggS family pyridoxal phosphate-dependent enzyme [Flavobacteriia bacterium]